MQGGGESGAGNRARQLTNTYRNELAHVVDVGAHGLRQHAVADAGREAAQEQVRVREPLRRADELRQYAATRQHVRDGPGARRAADDL